jgi:2-isopropylmalate synthase
VLIESHDKAAGTRSCTVGVSPNIVDASFEALLDSINFKLLKAGAK